MVSNFRINDPQYFGFADENLGIQKSVNDFLHTENFILVDKNLHIRGIYNGTLSLEIERLIKDIKTLEKE